MARNEVRGGHRSAPAWVVGCTLAAAAVTASSAPTVSAEAVATTFAAGTCTAYVVPPDVGQVRADLSGSQGGGTEALPGGAGGRVVALLDVTAGETLTVCVGTRSGFNGGGSAAHGGSPGGGATDVRRGGSGLEHRVAVAGGGGGGPVWANATGASTAGVGGGTRTDCGDTVACGLDGSQTAGGAAGPVVDLSFGCSLGESTAGSAGAGGNGGSLRCVATYEGGELVTSAGGGGGGGGWFGGGGGGTVLGDGGNTSVGPGGGGSNHVGAGATSEVQEAGVRFGDGTATLTPVEVAGITLGDGEVVDEGTDMFFPVTRPVSESDTACSVLVGTGTAGTATPGRDFSDGAVVVDFGVGRTLARVSVPTKDDRRDEPDETIQMTLSDPSNGRYPPCALAGRESFGTIVDDDEPIAPFSLRLDDPTAVVEGEFLTFNYVAVGAEIGDACSAVIRTGTAGTATPEDDFWPGVTSLLDLVYDGSGWTYEFLTLDDQAVEPNETVEVVLSPSEDGLYEPCQFLDGTAFGTILDDDQPAVPTWSVNDVSKTEGRSGDNPFVFSLTPSVPGARACDYTATFTHVTTNDSDLEDVRLPWSVSGNTATKPSVTLVIESDKTTELDETFKITVVGSGAAPCVFEDGEAVGTIVNDDAAPVITVGPVSKKEGSSGTSDMVFTVRLDRESWLPVTVRVRTSDGTAVAGSDYLAVDTVATVPAGRTSATVRVPIRGDRTKERDERFTLTLSEPTAATVSTTSTYGQIVNDD